MKWIGYIGSFLAGVLLTGGAYEIAGMLDNVAVLTGSVPPVQVAAHTPATRARIARRGPVPQLVATGARPVIAAELEEKIATLTPAEKAALKERRKARKLDRRPRKAGAPRPAGATPVGTAPAPLAGGDDTGVPAADQAPPAE